MKKLNLLKIIYKIQNNPLISLNSKTITALDKIKREFINVNDEICSYRGDSAFNKISDNVFITNTVNVNNLYALWLSRGNKGSIDDFLNAILQDQTLLLDENKW